jgi:hypothetical protein
MGWDAGYYPIDATVVVFLSPRYIDLSGKLEFLLEKNETEWKKRLFTETREFRGRKIKLWGL